MRGVSFGCRKTIANLTQKIHNGKCRNVGPLKGEYSNLSKDVQKNGSSKVLLLTDSDELQSDGI